MDAGQLTTVTADCDDMVAMLVRDGVLTPEGDWRFVRGTPSDDQPAAGGPLARRDYAASVPAEDGTDVRLACRVARGDYGVHFLAHAETPDAKQALHKVSPAAVFNWPAGTELIGHVTELDEAGWHFWSVTAWTPPAADTLSGPMLRMAWPLRIRSVSNGEWWFILVETAGPVQWGGATKQPYTLPIDFIRDPDGPFAANAAFYRGLLGQTPGFRRALTGVTTCADAVSVAAAVNAYNAHAPRDLRLHMLTEDEWAAGGVTAVPRQVAERLGVPDGTSTLAVAVAGHSDLGDATVGLLDCETREGDARDLGGPLQWALGGDYLAITVTSPEMVRTLYRAGKAQTAFALPWTIELELRTLLGDDGTRLCLVPVEMKDLGGRHSYLIAPEPDTVAGYPDRYRVGDAPWGKCRIYVDPAILHIVFDLPKEE
jgi:hypothetical protein